jgi:hypothetical protein
MKHLKPHLILESSNKLTKDHLDKVFSQFGVKSEFIPGRKESPPIASRIYAYPNIVDQLPQFKVTIEEPKLYGRSYGYEDYLDYINQIRDLGESFMRRYLIVFRI